MSIEARLCPRIESPCQTPPVFARGEKRVFCSGCQKYVHNLAALTRDEQSSLLNRGQELCVRYRRLLPIAVVLLAGAVTAGEDVQMLQNDEIMEQEMLGGTWPAGVPLEPVFIESEIAESFDEKPV